MKGSATTPRGMRAPAITAYGVNLSGASKTAMARPWRMWSHAYLTASRWQASAARAIRRIDDGYLVATWFCGDIEDPRAQREYLIDEVERLQKLMDRITAKIGGDWHALHDLRSPHKAPPTPAQYTAWMEARRAGLR